MIRRETRLSLGRSALGLCRLALGYAPMEYKLGRGSRACAFGVVIGSF